MNSQTFYTESFQKSDLINVSLKITKLRNLIDNHIISIESNYANAIDDIQDDITVDTIIDSVINSVSDNKSKYNNDIITECMTECMTDTSDKNSFSVSNDSIIYISDNMSHFLETDTEIPLQNKIKKYKISN